MKSKIIYLGNNHKEVKTQIIRVNMWRRDRKAENKTIFVSFYFNRKTGRVVQSKNHARLWGWPNAMKIWGGILVKTREGLGKILNYRKIVF